MDITLHLPDALAEGLMAEAQARKISVEELATERLTKAEGSKPEMARNGAIDAAKIMSIATSNAFAKPQVGDLRTSLQDLKAAGAFADRSKAHEELEQLRNEWR